MLRGECVAQQERRVPFFFSPQRGKEDKKKKKNTSRSAVPLFKTNPKLGARRAEDREGSEGGEGRQEGGGEK